MKFPAEFERFIAAHGIEKSEFEHDPIPRYIRLDPSILPEEINEIEAELGTKLSRVDWFPDFYYFDANIKISNSKSFKKGSFFGMDVASGVACKALDIQPNDQILDICCAPGTKLRYMADLLGKDGFGTITGVDISHHRLCTTKSLLTKHNFDRIRLFECDATSFDVRPPTRVGKHSLKDKIKQTEQLEPQENYDSTDQEEHGRKRIKVSSFVKPFHATKLIRNDPQLPHYLYDKVIVDAECTHDGSIAHLAKYSANNWDGFEAQFLDPKRLESLETLQRGLLANGIPILNQGLNC